ncbi:hypothetical protein GW17_00007049 [Ensete ventricosum]|nr:hypothetical protein GW17_00007049 [Ensete ventricosum]
MDASEPTTNLLLLLLNLSFSYLHALASLASASISRSNPTSDLPWPVSSPLSDGSTSPSTTGPCSFQVLYFAMKALRDGGLTTVYGSVERPLQLARTDCRGHGDSPWHCRRGRIFSLAPWSSAGLSQRYVSIFPFMVLVALRLPGCYGLGKWLLQMVEQLFFLLKKKKPFFFRVKHLIWVSFTVCRYSTFSILYPTRITSEVGLIYVALPYIKVSKSSICTIKLLVSCTVCDFLVEHDCAGI